MFYYLSVKGF